jgi:signal peptidase
MNRRPTPSTLARWVLDGALFLLVGLALAILVVARILPALGHETLVITGRSMEPAMPIGSAVSLDPVGGHAVAPGDAVAVGDIVTVRVPDGGPTISHRVVEVVDRQDGRWLVLQGDANPEPDAALYREEWVAGRVATVLPGFGYLIRLLSMPSGVLFVLGLATTLYLAARVVEEFEWEREDARRARVRRAVAEGTVRT